MSEQSSEPTAEGLDVDGRILRLANRYRAERDAARAERDGARMIADDLRAALDRVKALAEQWDKNAAADMDVESKTLRQVTAYLRAAVEGGRP